MMLMSLFGELVGGCWKEEEQATYYFPTVPGGSQEIVVVAVRDEMPVVIRTSVHWWRFT